MSFKFRTYQKNNIYGIKYKRLFIVPRDDDTFCVWDDNKYPFETGFESAEDAAWYIDKRNATDDEMKVLKVLYGKDISDLTDIMMKYYGKDDPASKYIYEMAKRIRDRKDEGKEW